MYNFTHNQLLVEQNHECNYNIKDYMLIGSSSGWRSCSIFMIWLSTKLDLSPSHNEICLVVGHQLSLIWATPTFFTLHFFYWWFMRHLHSLLSFIISSIIWLSLVIENNIYCTIACYKLLNFRTLVAIYHCLKGNYHCIFF